MRCESGSAEGWLCECARRARGGGVSSVRGMIDATELQYAPGWRHLGGKLKIWEQNHPPRHSNIQKPFFYLYRTRIPVSDNWIWNLISVSRSEPVGTKLFIALKKTVSLLTEYLTSLFQYYYLNPVQIYIRPWQPWTNTYLNLLRDLKFGLLS